MKAIYAKYPKAFALAVALHLVLLGVMVLSFDWTAKFDKTPPPVDVVKATAVDEKAIQQELNKIRAADEKKKRDEEDRVKRLEDKADAARKQREEEQTQLAELEKNKKKAEADRKKLEEENRKAEADRKRTEELAQKAKEDAIRALETKQRLEEEEARKRMMDEEAKSLQEQQGKKQLAEVDRYRGQVHQKIMSRWAEPPTAKVGASCTVKVNIIPATGSVISIRISSCNGADKAFERSVEAAVQKAQPLPTLKDPALAAHVRELNLVFRKEK